MVNESLDGTLAFYGGAVKALGGGKIGGYGVIFSGAKDHDLQGEYFTKSTDFELEPGERRSIYYRHATHPQIQNRKLGKAVLKEVDEAGAFFEGELNLRDDYERYIYKLAEMGKLGWSTGSAPHLVRKELHVDGEHKASEIKSWPIIEISLTPCPVEARTSAFPVKSLEGEIDELDVLIKSDEEYDEDFAIDGTPAIKHFCEVVSPTSMKDGSARSKAAVDATKEFNTIGKLLGEGFHSYASRLVRRTENRFLKEGREIHPATVQQVDELLREIGRIESAFGSVKDALSGIKKISDMSIAEQRAMNERARHEMWNFCRISGLKPEEIEHGSTS